MRGCEKQRNFGQFREKYKYFRIGDFYYRLKAVTLDKEHTATGPMRDYPDEDGNMGMPISKRGKVPMRDSDDYPGSAVPKRGFGLNLGKLQIAGILLIIVFIWSTSSSLWIISKALSFNL